MNRLPISDHWTRKALQISPQTNDSLLCEQPATAPRAFFLPVRYEPNYQYPLIVWLHHDSGNEQQVSDVMPYLSVQNYVAVGVRGTRAADAEGRAFDWLDSPSGYAIAEQSVMEAVDAACQRCSVNPQRVFIAGYRSGGTMAQRIALRNPQRFAGAVSLGGRFPRGGRPLANLQAARSLPILMGLAMESERFSQQAMDNDLRLVSSAKLQLEVQQYTSDDEMMVEVLRCVDRWMMNIVTGRVAGKYLPVCETEPVEFSAN